MYNKFRYKKNMLTNGNFIIFSLILVMSFAACSLKPPGSDAYKYSLKSERPVTLNPLTTAFPPISFLSSRITTEHSNSEIIKPLTPLPKTNYSATNTEFATITPRSTNSIVPFLNSCIKPRPKVIPTVIYSDTEFLDYENDNNLGKYVLDYLNNYGADALINADRNREATLAYPIYIIIYRFIEKPHKRWYTGISF